MATKILEAPRARITARVSQSTQAMLEEAAAFMGVPVNSFMVTAAVEKAAEVLEMERRITLSPEAMAFMQRLVECPPVPTEYAVKAMAEAKARLRLD